MNLMLRREGRGDGLEVMAAIMATLSFTAMTSRAQSFWAFRLSIMPGRTFWPSALGVM